MTSDLAAQRKARARAFIRQERAKWQRSWADLTYEYDRDTGDEQAHEGPQEARTAMERTARDEWRGDDNAADDNQAHT